MTFERSLQWELRLHSLKCKWIIYNQFSPIKSLFAIFRFVRIKKTMIRYIKQEMKYETP